MNFFSKCIIFLSIVAAVGCGVINSSAKKVEMGGPEPSNAGEVADPSVAVKGEQIAVFAGGCFWGIDAVFKHVKGVIDVKAGYSGGDAKTAQYERVAEGDTGHAESVRIKFDPAKVTYVQLLTVFFSVAHDPTQLNFQGPDTGPQYRSAIFYANDEQKKLALDYIQAIEQSKALSKPVVTQVVPLKQFYEAEAYHQNYLERNPTQPYIVVNDLPKLAALKKQFPDLYVDK